MNVQLHHVISDIVTAGFPIVDAILAGTRDLLKMVQLRGERIKVSEEVIAKSLVGNYRHEHLFTLKQALGAYRSYQKMIDNCDRKFRLQLQDLQPPTTPDAPRPPNRMLHRRKSNPPKGSFGPSCSAFDALI